MSGDINPAIAFLVGASMTENMNNHVENHKLAGENDSLRKQLERSKHTTLKGASGTNEYAKILYDKNEQIAELKDEISHIKSEENAVIGALKSQVSETRELAQAWEERAVVMEAKQDTWKDVVRNLLTNGEITITKADVQQRFNKYYDVVVETNLAAMRTKWNNR